MAKSNGFFTLRRGSTKSLTFQVVEGKQITKDRVSNVSNPRSQKQQFQRAIMATVMAAYSAMKDICDHSFQNKKKGAENQREFMSRNLTAMRNAFVNYQEQNPMPADMQFFAVGPKTPTVLPGAWEISRGNLAASKFLRYDDSDHTLVVDVNSFAFNVDTSVNPAVTSATAGDIADALGVYPGLQQTYCVISQDNGILIYTLYNEDYAKYVNFEFGYCRFIAKNFDRSKVYTTTESAQDAPAALIFAFLADIIDPRTDVYLAAALEQLTPNSAGTQYKVDAELAIRSAGFDESLSAAIGVITSIVDEDLRSTTRMITRNIDSFYQTLGLSWEYVPDAWRDAGTALGESDRYLEGGNI